MVERVPLVDREEKQERGSEQKRSRIVRGPIERSIQ